MIQSTNRARRFTTIALLTALLDTPDLQTLDVSHTDITGEGVARLKEALPNTKINY